EEYPARTRVADDPPGQLTLLRVAKKIADVNQLGRLPLDRRHPLRVAVTQGADRNPRGEIEIDVAGIIPNLGAAATYERDGRARIVFQNMRIVEIGSAGPDDGGCGHRFLFSTVAF